MAVPPQTMANVLRSGVGLDFGGQSNNPGAPAPNRGPGGAQTALGMIGSGVGLGLGVLGPGLVGAGIGRGLDARSYGNTLAARGIPDNVTMWSRTSPEDQFNQALEQQREYDRARGMGAGGSPDSSGLGSDGSPGGPSDRDSGGEGMGNGGNAWAAGGPVTLDRLVGPNPPGPDDGTGQLQDGEFVIRQAAAKKLGPEALQKINSGKYTKAIVAALKG